MLCLWYAIEYLIWNFDLSDWAIDYDLPLEIIIIYPEIILIIVRDISIDLVEID